MDLRHGKAVFFDPYGTLVVHGDMRRAWSDRAPMPSARSSSHGGTAPATLDFTDDVDAANSDRTLPDPGVVVVTGLKELLPLLL